MRCRFLIATVSFLFPLTLLPVPAGAESGVEIVILGGEGVVSSGVAAQLSRFGTVSRFAGPDRYATAAEISRASFAPGVPAAYLAVGANFPDALTGGPLAAIIRGQQDA